MVKFLQGTIREYLCNFGVSKVFLEHTQKTTNDLKKKKENWPLLKLKNFCEDIIKEMKQQAMYWENVFIILLTEDLCLEYIKTTP